MEKLPSRSYSADTGDFEDVKARGRESPLDVAHALVRAASALMPTHGSGRLFSAPNTTSLHHL